MYYKMSYDMESVDKLLKEGISYIYAEKGNLDEIEYPGIKKGFFNTIILKKLDEIEWPDVKFYYSSKASDRESDYLLNANRWPIVHERVKKALEKGNISGIRFYSIKLIDVITEKINSNYYVMYIENFIDAFDMEKSKYKYNEKYDMYTFIPKNIILNRENCEGYDIFRCNKSTAAIYVSEKLYDIVQCNKFTCFYFEEQQ